MMHQEDRKKVNLDDWSEILEGDRLSLLQSLLSSVITRVPVDP